MTGDRMWKTGEGVAWKKPGILEPVKTTLWLNDKVSWKVNLDILGRDQILKNILGHSKETDRPL